MSVRLVIVGFLMMLLGISPVNGQERARPNILIIVADDLGNGDLSAQGATDIATPHVDSLARSGVRFTNGYVTCPVCSPTRAGLLTGRYQERFGHEFNPGPNSAENFGLPLSQSTIADAFKSAGYSTGLVGKWHEGAKAGFTPNQRGFSEFFGFLGGAHAYLPADQLATAQKDPDNDAQPAAAVVNGNRKSLAGIYRDEKTVEESAYLTEAFGREAVSFIDRHQKNPFLLYLAFNAVHLPPHATQKYLDRFPKLEGQRKIYAAQLSALDDQVGLVLAKLRELKLEENTLIFFISDNGGPTANGSNNGIFRGTKGTVWEGGIRVPFYVQWKGHLPAGVTRENLVASIDIFPTALAASGVTVSGDKKFDGVNILPAAKGEPGASTHESLSWRFGQQWAVREGQWKLTKANGGEAQLFDLASDPGETRDVTGSNAEVARSLQAHYQAWNKDNVEALWKPQAQVAGVAGVTPEQRAARQARRAGKQNAQGNGADAAQAPATPQAESKPQPAK